MSARGLTSGLVLPIARGLVRSAQGGGGAPWGGLTNIVGFYPLNEASGVAVDSSATSVDLTAFNSPTADATGAPNGTQCRVKGATAYFTGAVEPVGVAQGYQYSLSIWFSGSAQLSIAALSDGGAFGNIIQLQTESGDFYVGTRNTLTTYAFGYIGALSSGVWHHAIVVVDGTSGTLYIDGAQVGTFVIGGSGILQTTSSTLWAAGADGYTAGTGKFWSYFVTRHALTAADAAFLYNSGTGRTWAQIQAYSP